jgi:orotate phosphoribosyltransferase
MGDLRPPRGDERYSKLEQIPELKWLMSTIFERALTRSDYYIDKFALFSDPAVLRRIARMFMPIVSEQNPDLIGGTELGGVILATCLAQMVNLPMIVVRKQPKGFGAFPQEFVEGPISPGQRVLLLEDIVTSGREVLAAKRRLEELQLDVYLCAVVNRGLAPVRSLVQFSLPRGDAHTEN